MRGMTVKHLTVPGIALMLSLCFSFSFPAGRASAACTALPTDRGTVTNTVSIPADGTYRVWSRIKTADSTKNSFLMQMDQTYCNVNVGGASITANTWTWVDYTGGTSTAKNNMTLTAGSHTLTMAGNADNVAVDRVIFTQDTSCVPSGTGDNCANPPDTTPPTISITTPTTGASISTTTTATASATDDTAVTRVEFYVDGVLKATDTTTPYNFSIDPAVYSAGVAHPLTAIAYDAAGNSTTSATVNFTIPDTTAPTITAVSSSSISQTTATITWTTNEASDSQVEYGTSTSYGTSTTLNTSKVTAHSTGLSGLTANTLYHYRVKSKDAAGNLQTSADATFTTQAPAADTTKPTVSITAPAAGTISGTVTLSATAADNVGVAGVQFKLGSANLGAEDTAGPYTYSWNTSTVANGTYTITAIARDAAGNTQTSSNLVVTVNNASPTVYLAEDINRSGHVDLSDFSILASNFNKTAAASSNPRADINGNGTVDLSDFSLLASKFGQ